MDRSETIITVFIFLAVAMVFCLVTYWMKLRYECIDLCLFHSSAAECRLACE